MNLRELNQLTSLGVLKETVMVNLLVVGAVITIVAARHISTKFGDSIPLEHKEKGMFLSKRCTLYCGIT